MDTPITVGFSLRGICTTFPNVVFAEGEVIKGPFELSGIPGLGLRAMVPVETWLVLILPNGHRHSLGEGLQALPDYPINPCQAYFVSQRKETLTLEDVLVTSDGFEVTPVVDIDYQVVIPEVVTKFYDPIQAFRGECQAAVNSVISQHTHNNLVGLPGQPIECPGLLVFDNQNGSILSNNQDKATLPNGILSEIQHCLRRVEHRCGIRPLRLAVRTIRGDSRIVEPKLREITKREELSEILQSSQVAEQVIRQETRNEFIKTELKLQTQLQESIYRSLAEEPDRQHQRRIAAINVMSEMIPNMMGVMGRGFSGNGLQPYWQVDSEVLVHLIEAIGDLAIGSTASTSPAPSEEGISQPLKDTIGTLNKLLERTIAGHPLLSSNWEKARTNATSKPRQAGDPELVPNKE